MSGSGRSNSRTIAAFLICIALLAHSGRAQSPSGVRLRDVGIAGTSALREHDLLTQLESRPGAPAESLRIHRDYETLAALYRAEGYYDLLLSHTLEVRAEDTSSADLLFRLTEGPRTVLGSIAIEGLTVVPEAEFRSSMTTREGAPLSEAELAGDCDALLGRLEAAGHPFAACSVSSATRRPTADGFLLDLLLGVEEGPRVEIGEITVDGNTETDAAVVVRETRLRLGEPYDPERVEAIRTRLQRLGIFEAVEEPELYLRGNTGGLRIRVREGNTNTFDGVLGYQPPRTAGEGGTVTGLVAVSMRNLFGSGRRFSLRWQRDDNLSQELGLRYMEPWVFGIPLNLGGGFFQRRQDTAYVHRVVDFTAELMITERLSLGASVLTENVIPSDSLTSRVLRSSTLSFGADVRYDTRDDAVSPTSGVRYRADYANGRKNAEGTPALPEAGGTTTVQRFGLDLDAYLGTFLRQVLVLGIHGRDVSGGTIEESEMYRLGGLRTLRGFRENQFLGSRIAWSTIEYRLLLGRRSFVSGFLDTGYIFRPPDEARGVPGTDLVTFGYGTGVQVETGLGIMAVSLALGKGDAFGEAKVHFGLINEF